MPIFIPMLVAFLVDAIGTIVGRVLVSLTIGFVTYQGFDTGMAYIRSQILLHVGSLGAQAIATLGGCEVGTAMSIVLSAMMVRLLIDGLNSGSIRKMVQKAPT